MRETVLKRSIFFLHKGALRRDSRGYVGLHRMQVAPAQVSLSAHEDAVTLTFAATCTTYPGRW